MRPLTDGELAELREMCSGVENLRSEDPLEPVDPLTYEDPDGDTCLHAVAVMGELRGAELLLEAGLDPNKTGDMGQTPLHHARARGYLDLAALLVRHGGRTDIVDEFGCTPLDYPLAGAPGAPADEDLGRPMLDRARHGWDLPVLEVMREEDLDEQNEAIYHALRALTSRLNRDLGDRPAEIPTWLTNLVRAIELAPIEAPAAIARLQALRDGLAEEPAVLGVVTDILTVLSGPVDLAGAADPVLSERLMALIGRPGGTGAST